MLSYIVLPKIKLSEIFYDLALSTKQFLIISPPFFMHFIYKEYRKTKVFQWILLTVLSFVVINGYFIALNPTMFVQSMFANEFSPLMGTGYGPAQLSFLGIIPIGRYVFTILLIAGFLISITFYITNYDRAKYMLFAFPIIISLLNYRLFVQYLYFWVFITLLPLQDVFTRAHSHEEHTKASPSNFTIGSKLKRISLMLVVLIVVGSGMAIHDTVGQGHS